jgi:hypothetical protein
MFQLLRDIGMEVLPSLQDETTQEPFNLVPVAVRAKRLLSKDLLIGFSISPQDTNRTISRITLGTPDVTSSLPGYCTTYTRALFSNLCTVSGYDSIEVQPNFWTSYNNQNLKLQMLSAIFLILGPFPSQLQRGTYCAGLGRYG